MALVLASLRLIRANGDAKHYPELCGLADF